MGAQPSRPSRILIASAALAATLLLALPACEQLLSLALLSDAWLRWTIDDTLDGADGVKLGDANGDELTDVVVPWEGSGRVKVYFNPGPDVAWSFWPGVVVGQVPSVEDAVFVDLDHDGATDVVSSAEGRQRSIFVHWAPQDPTQLLVAAAWTTEVLPAAQGQRQWMFCEPADIDGTDGIDLVAGAKEDDAQIGWFEAPPDPRELADWQWHPIAEASWIMSILPVDLDQDGDMDVVATDRKGDNRGTYWYENPGSGFAQRLPWPAQRIGERPAGEAMFLAGADIDDDGLIDLAVATNERQLILHRQTTSSPPAWQSTTITLSQTVGTGKGVHIADLNLDGQKDIAFSCEAAQDKTGVAWLSFFDSPADPIWHMQAISGQQGSKFDLVQLHDLDLDGDLDLLTTEENAGLGVVWYENPTR